MPSDTMLEYREGLDDLVQQLSRNHAIKKQQQEREKEAIRQRRKIERRLKTKDQDPGQWKPGNWDLRLFSPDITMGLVNAPPLPSQVAAEKKKTSSSDEPLVKEERPQWTTAFNHGLDFEEYYRKEYLPRAPERNRAFDAKAHENMVKAQQQRRFDALMQTNGDFRRKVLIEMREAGFIRDDTTEKLRPVAEFCEILLQRGQGSMFRAWRQWDPQGLNCMPFGEFVQHAESLGHSPDHVWHFLVPKDQRYMTLSCLDPITSISMDWFVDSVRAIVEQDTQTSGDAVTRVWRELDPRDHGFITKQSFLDGIRKWPKDESEIDTEILWRDLVVQCDTNAVPLTPQSVRGDGPPGTLGRNLFLDIMNHWVTSDTTYHLATVQEDVLDKYPYDGQNYEDVVDSLSNMLKEAAGLGPNSEIIQKKRWPLVALALGIENELPEPPAPEPVLVLSERESNALFNALCIHVLASSTVAPVQVQSPTNRRPIRSPRKNNSHAVY